MDVSIAIVGSGFSGLGLAVRLRQEGIEDFVVLERGDGVGGTWHYNTYPGCACDVPSHLYSFSFAPNPDWTRTYSRQPEIRAYLERVAEQVRRQDPAELRGHRRAVGRHALERRDLRRPGPRAGARLRHRAAGRAEAPGLPRAGALRGHHDALRALGPRRRPARQARGERRHGRVGDPVRPADRARRLPALRRPAHAAVGDAAQRAADLGLGAPALQGASRRRSARCAAASTPRASCSCSAWSSTRRA